VLFSLLCACIKCYTAECGGGGCITVGYATYTHTHTQHTHTRTDTHTYKDMHAQTKVYTHIHAHGRLWAGRIESAQARWAHDMAAAAEQVAEAKSQAQADAAHSTGVSVCCEFVSAEECMVLNRCECVLAQADAAHSTVVGVCCEFVLAK